MWKPAKHSKMSHSCKARAHSHVPLIIPRGCCFPVNRRAYRSETAARFTFAARAKNLQSPSSSSAPRSPFLCFQGPSRALGAGSHPSQTCVRRPPHSTRSGRSRTAFIKLHRWVLFCPNEYDLKMTDIKVSNCKAGPVLACLGRCQTFLQQVIRTLLLFKKRDPETTIVNRAVVYEGSGHES